MGEHLLEPFVPVPAVVLDEWMPRLSDTELRVLLVVIRLTQGWRDDTSRGRKARDWISRSQMRRRTGRESEALSRAVESLVRKGLIEVSDVRGCSLPTPSVRRRHGGRVYYRLSTGALQKPVTWNLFGKRTSKSEHDKRN